MAIGAMQLGRADYGIAISGVAGPGGGSKERPVGTVCFALGNLEKIITRTMHFEGQRDDVRNQSVIYAFTEINNFLKTLQN
jgi:nicotinamide-nucleotide amidase